MYVWKRHAALEKYYTIIKKKEIKKKYYIRTSLCINNSNEVPVQNNHLNISLQINIAQKPEAPSSWGPVLKSYQEPLLSVVWSDTKLTSH